MTKLLILPEKGISADFFKISFENNCFINRCTLIDTSSAFGITKQTSRSYWVRDVLNLKPPINCVAPVPNLLRFQPQVLLDDLFVPSFCYCFWNKGPDQKGFFLFWHCRKISFEISFDFTDSVFCCLFFFCACFFFFFF